MSTSVILGTTLQAHNSPQFRLHEPQQCFLLPIITMIFCFHRKSKIESGVSEFEVASVIENRTSFSHLVI